MEPVQGESGIRPATPEFLCAARKITRERNQLLMFDEVQCGLGRTGHWGGWRAIADDVEPDAVSWAKGIGGGLPLGAVWISARPVALTSGKTIPLCDLLGPGSHGTTFGGTPIVCAGATEVLKIVEEENLLFNAASMGVYAKAALEAIGSPLIKEVRGVGLLIAFELSADFAERARCGEKTPSLFLVERLHEAGLICIPSGAQSVRWLPALNVTRPEITEAAAIVARALSELA
jgi:acetylornithine/succinyldiaminopimelate/putrescine aminotransferase